MLKIRLNGKLEEIEKANQNIKSVFEVLSVSKHTKIAEKQNYGEFTWSVR